MSYVYVMEPPTKGKVIIHTNSGDLEIELWAKECPRTCRNFVQLCLEGYYDDTAFSRIIKGYCVQGGDPTGTGLGGESIYGKPFPDEFHPRLRFSHRGILAMASTGPDTNTSQFFFTLDKAEELTSRNTIFGKIVGDTIFNLVKISEAETDVDERPLYAVKILSVEVLHNPFDDIEPRCSPGERKAARDAERVASLKPRNNRPKGKRHLIFSLTYGRDMTLLSFGADEDEEKIVFTGKIKSSHDFKSNARMSHTPVLDIDLLSKDAPKDDRMQASPAVKKLVRAAVAVSSDSESDPEIDLAALKAYSTHIHLLTPRIKTQSRINALKSDIAQIGLVKVAPVHKQKKEKITKTMRDEFMGASNASFGKRRKGGEDAMMAKLDAFKNSLFNMGSTVLAKKASDEPECGIHGVARCESCCVKVESDEDDVTGWMDQKLVFKKRGANVYEVDDYLLIDPRIEANSNIESLKRQRDRRD